MPTHRTTAIAGAAIMLASAATAGPMYFNDFESGSKAGLNTVGTIEGTQGFSAHGFGDSFLRNPTDNPTQATVLTIDGFGEGMNVASLAFDLALINSWDGSDTSAGYDPDYFEVWVNGVQIFSETFSTFTASNQSFAPPAGSVIFERQDVFAGPHRSWKESAYRMGMVEAFQNIRFSGSTLKVSFIAAGRGYQGYEDESWAIDNIAITAIPLPSAATFGLAGLSLLGAARRR